MNNKIDLQHWLEEYERDYKKDSGGKYPIYIDEKGKKHEEKSPYFETMSAKLQKQGYLLKEEFVGICIWKTERQKKRYSENSDKYVKEITKEAFAAPEKDRVKILDLLEGVGVPVASAILTVVFPETYCIIDYRAWRALLWRSLTEKGGSGFNSYQEYSDFLDRCNAYNTLEAYSEFFEKMRIIGEGNGMTRRQVEMALWKFDQKKGKDENTS